LPDLGENVLKGARLYSTLGHVEHNLDDPRIPKMYVEVHQLGLALLIADVRPATGLTNPIRQYPQERIAMALHNIENCHFCEHGNGG